MTRVHRAEGHGEEPTGLPEKLTCQKFPSFPLSPLTPKEAGRVETASSQRNQERGRASFLGNVKTLMV